MIDYDLKEKLADKNSKYINILSYVFSKHLDIESDKLKEYLTKKLDKDYENIFKNITEDKYNKDKLDDMSLEEINKKTIKD